MGIKKNPRIFDCPIGCPVAVFGSGLVILWFITDKSWLQ